MNAWYLITFYVHRDDVIRVINDLTTLHVLFSNLNKVRDRVTSQGLGASEKNPTI